MPWPIAHTNNLCTCVDETPNTYMYTTSKEERTVLPHTPLLIA